MGARQEGANGPRPVLLELTKLVYKARVPLRPAPDCDITVILLPTASYGVRAACATPSTRSASHGREVPPAAPLGWQLSTPIPYQVSEPQAYMLQAPSVQPPGSIQPLLPAL